ncbi:MAG: EamA family transporter RarD [Gammaproteobacteria bacterium]|nr:EamA family transporter RarD [Gammaproteobacteria bacterium]MDH4253655.1 EamA family transporter RarD [Gammaproteobacteria bacterium]MDH5309771.1 EamA family transporter RarD [Gammaproteobacteria bacterium]
MSRTGLGEAAESDEQKARNGLASALAAYLMWGVLPIYIKLVQSVPSLEVLAHRILWGVPFGALIIVLRRQWPEVRRALGHRPTFQLLCLSAALIGVNWFLYIVAVQNNHVFQASLGYYINPLLYVLVGVLFLGERLRRLQSAAVLLAGLGVMVLTLSGGEFPFLALALAVSFTIYGVIRKQVAVGGMPGLFIETSLLFPLMLVYFGWLAANGAASFGAGNARLDLILILAGPVTVLPLLLFALAARRLQLTTIGMIQFMSPTIQFFIGVWYGETLTSAHLACFGCIWVAITLFSLDAWRESRRIQRLRAAARA